MANNTIKKAVIPIAGLATRFLPLSKTVSKEFFPLVDKPTIHYIVEEAKASGIKEIIFVTRPQSKEVSKYFEENPKLEKFLKVRKREHLLKDLYGVRELARNISFSFVSQKEPLGDGHAILQTKKMVKKEPFGVFFPDDVVYSKTPCLEQLINIFRTSQAPVIGLKRVSDDKIPSYGIVEVEKISSHLYKIKRIIEKPTKELAPSNLAIVGREILTPEVFHYLEKSSLNPKKELILSEVLGKMVDDGKVIYGYEFEGEWLECGNKLNWLKSNLYLSLKSPEFGESLKKFIDEENL